MQAVISQRVEQIRQWLAENQYDALLIPHEDEYLGEYIPILIRDIEMPSIQCQYCSIFIVV